MDIFLMVLICGLNSFVTVRKSVGNTYCNPV